MKTLDSRAQASFPGCQYSLCVVKHWHQESDTVRDSTEEDNWKLAFITSLDPVLCVTYADFSLYPFPVINCSCEYHSFQWFSVFPAVIKSEGALGTPEVRVVL